MVQYCADVHLAKRMVSSGSIYGERPKRSSERIATSIHDNSHSDDVITMERSMGQSDERILNDVIDSTTPVKDSADDDTKHKTITSNSREMYH